MNRPKAACWLAGFALVIITQGATRGHASAKVMGPRIGARAAHFAGAARAHASEVFVVAQDSAAAADAIAEAGAEVHHVFPPHVLFVQADDPAALARLPGVDLVGTDEVSPSAMARWGQAARLAAEVWNQSRRPAPTAQQPGPEPGPILNDMRQVPAYIAADRAARADQAPAPPGAGRYDTSEYMIGKVAVGIILPESAGSGEDWSAPRQNQVTSAIQQAMEWWRARRPTAPTTFYYDIHLSVPTQYEPIERSSMDEDLWINETLATLGYTDSGYFERTYSYVNAIRNALNTDWAFAIFVVDSYNDADGLFTDGYFAYAYIGGPFFVMTYDNDGYGISGMPPTAAHETGHIFYALDEYPGASSASDSAGYYNTINGNHQVGGITDVPCIMRGQVAPYNSGAVCPYSHGQIGHRDLNTNSIEDVVDVPPETTLTPYAPDPTTETLLTFSGTCTVVPLDNQNNPVYSHTLPPPDITINLITGVQYRADGGDWQPATATDGAFDSPEEDYTFTVTVAGGTHTIEARAQDSAPNADATPASDTVTVLATAPQVAQTYPLDGASDISRSITVTATFDQPMMASSINASTFVVRDGEGDPLSGTVGYDDATYKASFTPAVAMPPMADITATVVGGSDGVKNAVGMPKDADHVWSFATSRSQIVPIFGILRRPGLTLPPSGQDPTLDLPRLRDWIRARFGAGRLGRHHRSLRW